MKHIQNYVNVDYENSDESDWIVIRGGIVWRNQNLVIPAYAGMTNFLKSKEIEIKPAITARVITISLIAEAISSMRKASPIC